MRKRITRCMLLDSVRFTLVELNRGLLANENASRYVNNETPIPISLLIAPDCCLLDNVMKKPKLKKKLPRLTLNVAVSRSRIKRKLGELPNLENDAYHESKLSLAVCWISFFLWIVRRS